MSPPAPNPDGPDPQGLEPNTPRTGAASRLDRLAAAMEAFLRFSDRTDGGDREGFLARHEDLRDLLEPMLDDDQPPVEDEAEQPPNPSGLQPGRQVADYRIVREVGRGGMGIVFEAEQLSLHRRVALKLLHPHLSWSASSIERFRKEAAAAARLQHKAIVPIYEVGEWRGLHFFSMEFVEGRPLHQLLHDEHFGVRDDCSRAAEAAELVARVADALQHAHEHGLVHRDVKPHNIMIGHGGTVRLLDFGLAKSVGVASDSITGTFLGTPHYSSPEQACPRGEVGPGTDVFSLGIVLYELLARRRPFDGETTSIVLQRVETGEFEPLRRVVPSTPRDLETICHKALEIAPDARYDSAGAFADDLRRFLRIEPILARPPGRLVRSIKWLRRHRMSAALTATATLLVAGVPTAYALHQHNTAAAIEKERKLLAQSDDLGFRSIEQTLSLINEQLERQPPGMPAHDAARVDAVVRLCESFLGLRADDPRRRERVARALFVISHVYARISRLDAAMAACERGLELVRTATPKASLSSLGERLLHRRLHLQQQLHPDQSSADFERGMRSWHERATSPEGSVETAIEYADLLLLRARYLADQPPRRLEAEQLLRRAVAALPPERCDANESAETMAQRTRIVLGLVLLSRGEPAEALELLEPAAVKLGQLEQRPEIGVEHALATAAIGEARERLGEAGAAETSLRESIATLTTLSNEFPGASALRRTLLRNRVRLSSMLVTSGRAKEAERILREIEPEASPPEEYWLDRSLRADWELQLATCILMLAKTERDRDEAKALLHSAVELTSTLIKQQPGMTDLMVDLGGALHNLASIANTDGHHAEALTHATRAADHQRHVLAILPEHERATMYLGLHQSLRSMASARLGQLEQAYAAALDAAERVPRNSAMLRTVAQALCICAETAAGNMDIDTAERAQLSERYASAAVAMLAKIAVIRPQEARAQLQDKRFAWLRDREDFQQLSQETDR